MENTNQINEELLRDDGLFEGLDGLPKRAAAEASDSVHTYIDYDKAEVKKSSLPKWLKVILMVLGSILVCLIMFIASFTLSINVLKRQAANSNPSVPSSASDADIIRENTEYKEQIGILQAEIDSLNAKLEQTNSAR